MKLKKLALAATLIVIAVYLATWLVHRPKKITQEFASHFSQERYEQCAEMLQAPSSMEVSAAGDLVLVDHAGNSMTVLKDKLPFKVGGGRSDDSSDFSMICTRRKLKREITHAGSDPLFECRRREGSNRQSGFLRFSQDRPLLP